MWVLIVMMLGNGIPSVETKDFYSKSACIKAAATIESFYIHSPQYIVQATCQYDDADESVAYDHLREFIEGSVEK